MRRLACVLAGLTACNPIYGIEETRLFPDADLRPDIDRDMLADEEDPCIAGPLDRADDLDGDGMPADTDACPFHPPGPDTDGDGVMDACDVYPMMAGERWRCMTRFLDSDVTVALWQARMNERTLASASGYLLGYAASDATEAQTSMVSVRPLLRPTGTSQLLLGTGAVALPYRFRLWVSAGGEPSTRDVGCELVATPTQVSATIVGASDLVASAPGPAPLKDASFFVSAELVTDAVGPNITCAVGYTEAANKTTVLVGARGRVEGPVERQGFAIAEGAGIVSYLLMYERD